MNLCVCCGKDIPEGEQVCYNCKQISKEDKPFFVRLTLSDLLAEEKRLIKELKKVKTAIVQVKKAERRL